MNEVEKNAKLEWLTIDLIRCLNPLDQSFKGFGELFEVFLSVREELANFQEKFDDLEGENEINLTFESILLIQKPIQRVFALTFFGNCIFVKHNLGYYLDIAFSEFGQVADYQIQFLLDLMLLEYIESVGAFNDLKINAYIELLNNYSRFPQPSKFSFLLFEAALENENLIVINTAQYITKKYEFTQIIHEWLKLCVYVNDNVFLQHWYVIKELLIEEISKELLENKPLFVTLYQKLLRIYNEEPENELFKLGLKVLCCQLNEQLICRTNCEEIFDLYITILEESNSNYIKTIENNVIDPVFTQIIFQLQPSEIKDTFSLIEFLECVFKYVDNDFIARFSDNQQQQLFLQLRKIEVRGSELFFAKYIEIVAKKRVQFSFEEVRNILELAMDTLNKEDFTYEDTIYNIALIMADSEHGDYLDLLAGLQNGQLAYCYLLKSSKGIYETYEELKSYLSETQRQNICYLFDEYNEEIEKNGINFLFELLYYNQAQGRVGLATKLLDHLKTEVVTTKDKAQLLLFQMQMDEGNIDSIMELVNGAICEYETLCEIGYYLKVAGKPIPDELLPKLQLFLKKQDENFEKQNKLARFILTK